VAESAADGNIRGAILFAPGDNPRRMLRALESSADGVVLDLEDGVAEHAKEVARAQVVETVRACRRPVMVRVNPPRSGAQVLDLDALSEVLPRVAAVFVPKVESAADLADVVRVLAAAEQRAGLAEGAIGLVPILESARGILAAVEVAAAPRVRTLVFGTLDLAADLGVTPTIEGIELLHARSRLVLAARAGGVAPPIDGPHAALDDDQGLELSTQAVRDLGFGGRVVIHPRQIDVVKGVYAPTADELAWARTVLGAYAEAIAQGRGAGRLPDGSLVERPVAERARGILAQTNHETSL